MIVQLYTYIPVAGDYFVVSTKGFVGFMIQLGTFSKMNHTGIYIGNGKIVEATPRKGVIISDLSQYDGLELVWNHEDNPTPEQRKIMVDTALAQVGKKYFFADIVIIGFRILGVPVPMWIQNKIAKSNHQICSGTTTICARAAGYTVEPTKPFYFVTPSDLMYRLLWLPCPSCAPLEK